MGLVEQGVGAAEGAVCRESSDDKEHDCNRRHSSRYQEDATPGAFRMSSDAAPMPMLRPLAMLLPVPCSVAVRVGAALPAVPVRGQLRA